MLSSTWASVGGSSFPARSQGSEAIMEPHQCQCGQGFSFYQLLHFLFIFKINKRAPRCGIKGTGAAYPLPGADGGEAGLGPSPPAGDVLGVGNPSVQMDFSAHLARTQVGNLGLLPPQLPMGSLVLGLLGVNREMKRGLKQGLECSL